MVDTTCQGPCLQGPRCYRCAPYTTALAYAAIGYAIACAVYLVATRCVGTPFRDSLTDDQRRILRESKRTRGAAFGTGVAVAVVVLVLWRPFTK